METIFSMTMTALDRALVTGDPGWVAGERQDRADPEVPEKARRRRFTAQYKLDVVAEYDAAPTGEKGAVLRREGLYSSHALGRPWTHVERSGAVGGSAHGGGHIGCGAGV
jgi:transposase